MSKLPPFSRRTYTLRAFWRDFREMMGQRALIRKTVRHLISPQFRERLMMVVTEVNGCRYCRYFHVQESAKAGLSERELRALLTGQIPPDAPAEEIPALFYAQHWAAQDGNPDPEYRRALEARYGSEMAEAIHIVLRMIRMGNLLGNTWDYLLYRFSFGRWGLLPEERDPSKARPSL